MIQVSAVESV